MTDRTRPSAPMQLRAAANDDFKRSFSSWFWGSMIAATAIHFLAFAMWPQMSVEVADHDVSETPIVPAPDVKFPKPPPPISRPATPVIAEDIDPGLTIPDVVFPDNPVEHLPPPPDHVEAPAPDAPHWVVFDVHPYIKNRDELRRALEREYPPLLRDAGIGGTAKVWFYVDETGKVVKTQVHTSSGHKLLDDAALRVAHLYEFAPALRRDKAIAVWVSLDVTFRPR